MVCEKLELKIEGNEVESDWWTKEVSELFCSLCPKMGTSECDKMLCQSSNPWCG